jgi:hypothetical protein
MLEDVRKYVRLGLEALSSQGSNDAAGAARSRASGVAGQLSTLAAGFLEWSAEARASLLNEMKELVARQVQEMGVATQEDLEGLRDRLERLEASLGAGDGSDRSAARAKSATGAGTRATSKASAPRRATAPRSKTAGSSGKRTGRARRTAARGSR